MQGLAARHRSTARRWKLPLSVAVVCALVLLVVPASILAAEAGTLRQQCIEAALQRPSVKKAYVVHPGKRPWENNPHVVGPVQTTVVSLQYGAVAPTGQPDECDNEGIKRYALTRLQKTVNGRWRKLDTVGGIRGNAPGYATGIHKDDGHGEADWEYLKPGDKERLSLYLKAEDPETGRTLASATRFIRVKIVRRHKHG